MTGAHKGGRTTPEFNRVCVVGSLNFDLSARAPHLPAPGETVLGRDFRRGPGGKGVNQAVAARRAGAPTSFVGRVGKDDFGLAFRDVLRAEGIDDAHLSVDPDEPTGVGLIALSDGGENQILVAPGANMTLCPAHIAEAGTIIDHANILLLQGEIPPECNRAAAARARASGIPVMFNAAPASESARDLLSLVDVLVVNEPEAAVLSGRTDPTRAAEALGARAPAVIVTLGEGGLLACIDGVCRHQPAFRARQVDSVGAGDAFCGILATLWRRVPDDLALRLAQAGASVSVERPGAIASMPTWPEIDARARLGEPQRAAGAMQ